jgi:hypothetical protein
MHMTLANVKYLGFISALLAGLLTQVACGSEQAASGGTARGEAVSINHSTQALTIGELASVNGTYGALCTDRTGSWSVEIAAAAPLDNAALSVVLNDAACVLTVTSLHTTAGIIAAVPAVVLTTSFKPTASTFGSPVEFYANAKLSAVTFASNFVLTILFSNDPALAAADNTALFDVVVATATAGAVDAPDYTLAADGLLVRTDVNDVVQSVTGTAGLTAGSMPGQSYVVVAAADLDTYAKLDAAFIAGTAAPLVLAIPAADFTLVGADLTTPQVRTLIVANIVNAVASYEAFQITFHPAP